MFTNRKPKLQAVLWGLSLLLTTFALAVLPASPAHADPGCKTDGAYVLFARGSGAAIGSDEAHAFRDHVSYALQAKGISEAKIAWAELGNLDNSQDQGEFPDDPGEYPATAVPWSVINGDYHASVAIGTDELVHHLNDRYAGDGPTGSGPCSNEVAVIGGYSQGADVVGWAFERNGGGGYASLFSAASSHVGAVALYGDPRFNVACGQARWWVRGNAGCSSTSRLQPPRSPYAPVDMQGRLTSWCDNGDGICAVNDWTLGIGNHTTVYRDWWIWQSAAEVASDAAAKVAQLNQPPPTNVGNANFRGTDTLVTGQQLHANQYILSNNVRNVLIMQPDGNLVLYGDHYKRKWASGTAGHPGAYLGIQGDGNLVIYHNGQAIWASGTTNAARLVMQDDGNLVARSSSNSAVWASGTDGTPIGGYLGSDKRNNNQRMYPGDYIRSADKRYALLLQGDGNLVLYAPGYRVLWASNTGGNPSASFVVQADGNMVIYKQPGGPAIWVRGNKKVVVLKLQNDGNLVARNSSGGAVWATGTDGRL